MIKACLPCAGFRLRYDAGEIVGLAGVAGNGQSELAQVISGLRNCAQGKVELKGEVICNQSSLFAIQKGLAYIPEDRTHVGSAPNLSVTDNVIMKNIPSAPDWTGLDGRYEGCHTFRE